MNNFLEPVRWALLWDDVTLLYDSGNPVTEVEKTRYYLVYVKAAGLLELAEREHKRRMAYARARKEVMELLAKT